MAVLETKTYRTSQVDEIRTLLANEGLAYECWGTRTEEISDDSEVLAAYRSEIDQLKRHGSYVHMDLVALHPQTPHLDEICANFAREHHHCDDEVRFTVEGEGVFEIRSLDGVNMLKLTTSPGDLIVIPAYRRHLFYLTEEKHIRCIRLFRDAKGWEAIYASREAAMERRQSPQAT